MATRIVTRQPAKADNSPKYTCRDCAHSYDWHEIGFDGKPFMCRCQYYTAGKYCRFLKDQQCEHFQTRNDNDQATTE